MADKYVVSKLLNKKDKEPGTKAAQIQHLDTLCTLPHKRGCIALKKQHGEKNKEEAAKYVCQTFDQENEGAKENARNGLPREKSVLSDGVHL